MPHEFTTPAKIVHACGSLELLGKEASRLGKKALLVSGRGSLEKSGALERIRKLLAGANVRLQQFTGVEPEPDVTSVDAGRALFRQARCDLVIAAGGGSVIDVGKAIACLAGEDANTAAFLQGRNVQTPGFPSIAIPTTSGTGAEATPNSVISDRSVPVKQSIRGAGIMPTVALLDPELTLSCPPALTAHSGLDALTQAIESLVSIHATPLTKALSLHAVRLLKDSVLASYKDGADLAARSDAAYGSLLAGIALANARLGAVHGIAHPLGVRYAIPHGLVCGVLLPYVMDLNEKHAAADFAELRVIFGREPAAFVRRLLKQVGMPQDLSAFGLREADFPVIAEESMPSGSLKANPKKVEPADIIEILKKVA